ncbi:4-hydroxy-tetrahydrodipicolinate reductase [Treponema parvum]|uniref:4-hydroxy-tetrahydrodipicolinate reductase n=1 Tax=Treponema parvum TaxID=138851 RepID=A0A975ICK8_9SPIR|nr:4-hydroxy-tetrahydrodipicolinate reductase [Treponema parvum]QTQ11818.1 4-hydroxy-tetrahydrodipicolinate reductase [Treponema parvum]
MKMTLIGYGKMGHLIADVAKKRKHDIVATIDVFSEDASVRVPVGSGKAVAEAVEKSGAECVIDFSHPSAIIENIKAVLPTKIPMIVGTTGWNNEMTEIEKFAASCGGTIMASSNFSIGVNLFYKIIEEAVKLVKEFPEYDIATWEMHHNQKADSPSGTALEIAKRILSNDPVKKELVTDAFHGKPQTEQLHVSSTRCGYTPGTHTVWFDSSADTIELTHRARNREGFALGAVIAAEKLLTCIKNHTISAGKLYTMKDLF